MVGPSEQGSGGDDGALLNWEVYETEICRLFISHNRTWREVAMEISKRYYFTAMYTLPFCLPVSLLTGFSERQ